MEFEAGQCSKTSMPYSIFIVAPSLEGWPPKGEEAPCHHEVGLVTYRGQQIVWVSDIYRPTNNKCKSKEALNGTR